MRELDICTHVVQRNALTTKPTSRQCNHQPCPCYGHHVLVGFAVVLPDRADIPNGLVRHVVPSVPDGALMPARVGDESTYLDGGSGGNVHGSDGWSGGDLARSRGRKSDVIY